MVMDPDYGPVLVGSTCVFLFRFPCALWVAFGNTVPHFVHVCVTFSCVSTGVCVLGWRPRPRSPGVDAAPAAADAARVAGP